MQWIAFQLLLYLIRTLKGISESLISVTAIEFCTVCCWIGALNDYISRFPLRFLTLMTRSYTDIPHMQSHTPIHTEEVIGQSSPASCFSYSFAQIPNNDTADTWLHRWGHLRAKMAPAACPPLARHNTVLDLVAVFDFSHTLDGITVCSVMCVFQLKPLVPRPTRPPLHTTAVFGVTSSMILRLILL